MRTMSRATINYDMSADTTRDTRSESRLWVTGIGKKSYSYVTGTQKKSYPRRDHDHGDAAKCKERLMGAGSQFLRIEDCFIIITLTK
jgi:hypothetical protein